MSLESIFVYLFKEFKKRFAFSYKYQDEKFMLSHRPPFLHEYRNINQEHLDYDF